LKKAKSPKKLYICLKKDSEKGILWTMGERFDSPEREIQHLREQIESKERQLQEFHENMPHKHEVVSDEIKEYGKKDPNDILENEHRMKIEEIDEKILHLKEGHREKMQQFIEIMEQNGLRNALSAIERADNPHIEDDFHRFLVQYFIEIGPPKGVREGTPLFRSLQKKLFEVKLLKRTEGEERKFTDLIKGMEQLYAGMLSMDDDKGDSYFFGEKSSFTFEIAQSNKEEEIVFYCAVPRQRERLFEKHLLGIFPDARLKERKDDYNIFTEGGATLASYGKYKEEFVFPIKTYDEFEQDPLQIVLNAFSKIKKEGEGAAIQFVLSPAGDRHNNECKRVILKLEDGVNLKEATQSIGMEIAKEFGGTLKDMVFGVKPQKNEEDQKEVDTESIEKIKKKMSSHIFDANIRLVASAATRADADMILSELESVFNQFSEPNSNSIIFKRVTGQSLNDVIRDFTFRYYYKGLEFPINSEELTTLFHFPVTSHSISDLREVRSKQAPAPTEAGGEGVLVGINEYQGEEREVRLKKKDRLRHLYVIGQTGTGKTVLLKNMIAQDMKNGDGACFIDPHGSDIEDILANVPKERYKDVVYFDPANTDRPMGLNMLEYDHNNPEQKTFVVNELFSIFQKLYGGSPESMGPIFEQYFRNATMLVVEDPASGSTLLEVSRVMSDEKFRNLKLSRCKNPIVVQFWREIATKAGGDAALANIVPYITSKFDVFMANDIMRPIIAQEKSAFNFREIMDNKKILLINLSKGRLGGINSSLIGLIIVGKILMAALSRVDMPEEERNDFYLYIDEFQNVTTDSISTILSEARKYKLSLNVVHQYIAQLEENIKDAVFGNVGSMVSFRVSSDDAEYLESQFAPNFDASDIMNIDNFNTYAKIIVNGRTVDAFNMRSIAPVEERPDLVEHLKELSYRKYGGNRAAIEADIARRFGR
jgi:hypothetical protein